MNSESATNGKSTRVMVMIPPTVLHLNRDIGFKEVLPHIGVAYIAAVFKAAGAEVCVVDGPADRLRIHDAISLIGKFKPDILGLTASTYQINEAASVAHEARAAGHEMKIIIGGYHVSALPAETLREYPCFDAAVYGEGELTVTEYMSRLDNGISIHDLPGTAVRLNGDVVLNPPREAVKNLDELPFPAFDLMPLHRYRGFYTMRSGRERPLTCCTARGCPFKCIFCFKSTGSLFRKRSVDSVMEELRIGVETYKASQIVFTDEIFTFDKVRTRELCERMISQGYPERISWICQDRVDLADAELLKLMKRAGCSVVSYGVEAGNQAIVDSIRKNFKLSQARDAIRWTKEAGIWADTNFIIGHPGEDESMIMDTINFAIDLDPDSTSFAILCPFPGTEVARMAKAGEGGLKLLSEDWSTYGKQIGEALELEGISRRKLERYHRMAYYRFFFRRRKWLSLFKIINPRAVPIYMIHTVIVSVKSILGIKPRVKQAPAACVYNDESLK